MSISKAVNSKVTSQSSVEKRLQIERLVEATQIVAPSAGSDVVKGLTQTPKSLPPVTFMTTVVLICLSKSVICQNIILHAQKQRSYSILLVKLPR